MIRIALVGNIASGKSTVEKFLTEKYGFSVLDTDKACHFLLEKLSAKIIQEFKNYEILDENGRLSREKLGKIVFYNEDLKTKLENILYPNLRVEINKYFEESILKPISEKLELGEFNSIDLTHNFVNMLLTQNVPITYIRKVCGYPSIKTFLEVYNSRLQESEKEYYNPLDMK